MKKLILGTIAVAISAVACNKLNLQPKSSMAYNNFWTTEESVVSAHTGVYSKFRGYAHQLWRLGEMRSDIWGGVTIESPYEETVIANDINPNRVFIDNWGNFYTLLHYVNDFIKSAPTVPTKSQDTRDHMMGQMHGLRAFIYFTMLKTWGDVPLTTEPQVSIRDLNQLNKPRSSKAEVMHLIKEDLQKSLDYFGANKNLFKGTTVYWSKAATLALKGEMFLFAGSVLGEGNAAYTEAKNALMQIEGFTLLDDYRKLWGKSNEGNKEFIFAFDYQQNQANGFHLAVTSALTKDLVALIDKNGNSMKTWVQGGQNRYALSPKVLETFAETPNDKRGDATVFYLYKNNGNVGYPVYTPSALSTTMLNKFIGEIVDGVRRSFANIPVYRYADVLLLLAEAKNMLGEDPSAEINAVRARSGVTDVYTNQSMELNRDVILKERLKEFIGEGKRWWDLQRAGVVTLAKEVESYAKENGTDPKKIYLPISVGMIDKDPNNLMQTEGY